MSLWQKVAATLFIAGFLWATITNAIFQFENPGVTQTEALLHFPKTITMDFTP